MYSWLRELGLKPAQAADYTQLFATEALNERVLQMTTPEELLAMGITKLGHRILILHSLQSKGHYDLIASIASSTIYMCIWNHVAFLWKLWHDILGTTC